MRLEFFYLEYSAGYPTALQSTPTQFDSHCAPERTLTLCTSFHNDFLPWPLKSYMAIIQYLTVGWELLRFVWLKREGWNRVKQSFHSPLTLWPSDEMCSFSRAGSFRFQPTFSASLTLCKKFCGSFMFGIMKENVEVGRSAHR